MNRKTERHRERHRERQRERQRERETHTHTHTHRDRQTQRERQTETETETEVCFKQVTCTACLIAKHGDKSVLTLTGNLIDDSEVARAPRVRATCTHTSGGCDPQTQSD
jgi:hypothetical protein